MNEKQRAKILHALKEKSNMTKDEAREYLIKLGIYYKDGKLTKEYGG